MFSQLLRLELRIPKMYESARQKKYEKSKKTINQNMIKKKTQTTCVISFCIRVGVLCIFMVAATSIIIII